MTNLTQKLDFKGQTISVGMDVHLKSWNVSLYFGTQYLKSFNQPSSPTALSNYLLSNYPGAKYQCAYEAGFCGYWIQRALKEKNIECIVVNPCDIPQTDKGSKNKNDKNDSKRIAVALQAGQLMPIYIPSPEQEADRLLVRCNEKYSGDLVRIKNRIKGILHQIGIEIPLAYQNCNWNNSFLNWLKELSFNNVSAQLTMENHLFLYQTIRQQKLKVLKDIRTLLRTERYSNISKFISSVPGIGPVTAATLIVEIGDMKRFNCFEQLNSFIGFCPLQRSSGDSDHKGKLTTRQHLKLRRLLVEAAWTAVRIDPALTLCFNDLKNKVGARRAIIKIARKLLSRIRYVWLNQTEYVKGVLK